MPFSRKTLTTAAGFVLVCLALFYQQFETPKNTDNASRTIGSSETIAKDDCAGLAAGCPALSPAHAAEGHFDFYVLSLSWSPTWCRNNPDKARSRQCSGDYGFIVHGLWPQNEAGFPEFCATSESDRVAESLGKTMLDIVPDMGLIGHEWRKHGTCSQLPQRDYFKLMRSAWNRITMPAAFKDSSTSQSLKTRSAETAFIAANPGLTQSAIAITCDGPLLDEVRICMNKDLSFRSCAEVDRNSCRLPAVTVLPARQ
jgi:ribonuclease T2